MLDCVDPGFDPHNVLAPVHRRNTRRKMGLTFEQVMIALEALLQAPNWSALTITEVNPDHGLADGSTIRDVSSPVTSALSRTATLL
jgi:arginase family enzyme